MLKVLIIDDDDIVILVQGKLLQNCKVTQDPIKFKRASEAVEYLHTASKEHHYLLMLDINMPLMNGWQFLDEIDKMAVKDNIYVLMVTSSIDYNDKEKAKNYDKIINFIEKPITAKNCDQLKELPILKPFFQKSN
ncbi:response regulator receiver domain-containing protein [Gillisia mitskevichiae]|uniref:Response regulator receiver domain-containing protein n=1 Tax=Gillisia mitskevichiae TaxID=270921 RepID=A0A495PIJ0_9FLAO|nr:response regulator [Gillisia mitskevichiae]RKS50561.1 response regulator receiver domain-containing protein [Gillisia mitskevichiae]